MESPPLARPKLILFVVAGGTLLNTLAASTINLALPLLGKDLGVSIDLSRWVMMTYFLAMAVALPLAGRTADLLGHRKIYLLGFLLFGVTSLLCGAATSFWVLLAARVLQAGSGAMIVAAGPALLTTTFAPEQRGSALGVLGTATYVGLTIGPPLGGVLLTALSWRWVFFLYVPVAAVVVLVGRIFLPRRAPGAGAPFDRRGALTLTVGLPLLLISISEGVRWGWISWPTLGGAGLGLITMSLFVKIQLSTEHPLLDLRLFRSRVFTSAAVSAVCNYIALFIPMIMLPFYLMEALALSPAMAGGLLSAQPLAMALLASPSGWLSDRIGTRTLAFAGMLIMAGGMAGLSTLGPQTSHLAIVLWLVSTGLGTGIFISPNSSALMGAAPAHQQGVAGAMMSVARTLGMMMGISGGTAIFQAAGGQAGHIWVEADFHAMQLAMIAAAAVSVLGALATLFQAQGASRSSG